MSPSSVQEDEAVVSSPIIALPLTDGVEADFLARIDSFGELKNTSTIIVVPDSASEETKLVAPTPTTTTAPRLPVSSHLLTKSPYPSNRLAHHPHSHHPHSRRNTSFFARFSSAAAKGLATAIRPPNPLGQSTRRQSIDNHLNRPASITSSLGRTPSSIRRPTRPPPRDGPEDRDSSFVPALPQTSCNPDPVSQSHDHDPSTSPPSTTSALSRTTSVAPHDSVDDKHRGRARRASSFSSAPPQEPTPYAAFPVEPECKMHQTSSRLLRMTDDDRPFTRDFKDLFSTLMVSLPLTSHRVRFQKIEHTFTSEEAVTNLGSLKFSQSNRMPDPKDPSRIVTTTTTTTFSMAKEMARSVCTKFLEARFVESADGKNDFSSKSAVWQLTPKGMHILQRFCQRNGINQRHVFELLASPRNTMNLVLLEREQDTDKIHRDVATIEVVFRRFVGPEPNIKYSTSNSDSDSLSEYQTGLVGVKLAKERKVGDKTYHNTFTGKSVADWLMDCCTMVDKRETYELAQLFCDYQLMQPLDSHPQYQRFSPSKHAIYTVTEKGQRVAGWIANPKGSVHGDLLANGRPREGATRDSNTNRMTVIIRDAALRLLFREFLRDTHCEENLAFYLDVKDFLANYNHAKKVSASPKLEIIRETLAAAYSLYNAFLAPGSPCELNIDHSLRTSLAARMTRAVGDDEAMIKSLDEVATLFDQAQNSVFKLMASDSVPKFMREPKYASIIRERNLDQQLGSFIGTTRTTS